MDFQDKRDEKQEPEGGKLEKLESQVRRLLMESKDAAFTEYLRRLTERVRNQVYQTDLLQDELDRTYRTYLQKTRQTDEDLHREEPFSERRQFAEAQIDEMQADGVLPPQQTMVQPPVAVNFTTKPPAKRNVESTIAVVALSILGGMFILMALVTLWMTIADSFVKGIGMYVISLEVLLVSELFVYHRLPKLGGVLSALSFGGLYLTTMLNYGTLDNFNFWTTAGIVLVISIAMLLMSKKRNSAFYRIFGVVSCYLSFMNLQWVFTDDKYFALIILYLLINMMCILLPVKSHRTGINLTHMSFNLLFSFIMYTRPDDYGTNPILLLLFVGSSILLHQVLLMIQVRHRWNEVAQGKDLDNTGLLTVHWLGIIFYSLMLSGSLRGMEAWILHGSVFVLAVFCLLSFVLLRKGTEKWYSYYFFNVAVFVIYVLAMRGTAWSMAICVTAMLLGAKLLSLTGEKVLRVSEAFITTLSCLVMLICPVKHLSGLIVCAAILISLCFLKNWQTYYECVITYSIVLFAALQLKGISALSLAVFTGLLFAAQLLFHSVKRFRGKNILVFNILTLTGQGICYCILGSLRYANEYLTYFCMLIFGAATIILLFREKYEMDFQGKYLVLVIFLSYMALILRTDTSVINSIFLMLIALISVGTGFVRHRKEIRIYGLVLSLLVCGKIVLYDYWSIPTLQKTMLFFVIGVIALVIAGIYIVLEKKDNTTR